MGSRGEEEEEGLVNEFEEAYQQQDYARLAELMRFIRSEGIKVKCIHLVG